MVRFFLLCLSSVGLMPRLRPPSSSRQSAGHYQGVAAAERPKNAAPGTACEYYTFSFCGFHLCNSRLTGACPPPTHQPLSSGMYARRTAATHRRGATAAEHSRGSVVRPRQVRYFLLVWFCLCSAHASLVLWCCHRSEVANRSLRSFIAWPQPAAQGGWPRRYVVEHDRELRSQN